MDVKRYLVLVVLVTGAALAGASAPLRAAELVMFESATCEWCDAWHEEICVVYPNTEESRRAPLRRVSIDGARPSDLRHLRGIQFTPTFVVMDEGKEVGRILGYPGESFFWELLDMILKKLPDDSRHACRGALAATQKGGTTC
jgi:hypothetical protein